MVPDRGLRTFALPADGAASHSREAASEHESASQASRRTSSSRGAPMKWRQLGVLRTRKTVRHG